MKLGPWIAAILLAGGVAGTAYWIKSSANQQATQASPFGGGAGGRRRQTVATVPVSVGKVAKQSVPVYREGIGNVQALNNVIVRAQVDGRLLGVEFKEGQDVKKGDVLARIDPVTFKAQYDQAVAKKAQDEANVANMRLDLERYQQLAKNNAGPKQQADQQAALVAQMVAQIQSDQAAIDNAKAILDYTTIVAPLDGRTGLRQVDAGNIVHASDANGIVSITQLKPIAVLFTLPQRDLDVTATALAAGKVPVEIPNTEGTKVLATGTLQSIDNQIDVTTGTIKLKANFPNDDLNLWPGQFVSVRAVVATMTDVNVVPATAIRRGVDGNDSYNFVYTVGADNVAHIKRVKVPLQDEKIAVVEGEIAPGDTVVTEGFTQLTDGKDVLVSGAGADGSVAPSAAGAAKASGDAGAAAKGKGAGRKRNTQDGTGTGGTAKPAADGKAGNAKAGEVDTGAATGGSKRAQRRRDEAAAESPGAVGLTTGQGGQTTGARP